MEPASSSIMLASSSSLHYTSHAAPHLQRILRDMMELNKEPPPGILVVHDESDMTTIHAIIIGSRDTPYEGGFFYFRIHCTTSYPNQPPQIRFMTTDGGKVRLNPNLYQCGRVCMSLINTYPGPPWSSTQTLSSLLVSIQALILNDKPYHNEPGYDTEIRQGEVLKYNEIIQHETIRVAVIGMVDNEHHLSIPKVLMEQMKASFLNMFSKYELILNSRLHLVGKPMSGPHFCPTGYFQHDRLLKRLRVLKQKLGSVPRPLR